MMKQLRVAFLIGLTILIVDAAVPLVLAQRTLQLRIAVATAQVADDRLAELLSAYKDSETGQRGFMLTGQQEFLEPYEQGRAAIAALLPQITATIAADTQQAERLQRLRELDREQNDYQQERIEARRHDERIAGDAAMHGKLLMDTVRKQIDALRRHEQKRVADLSATVARIDSWSQRSIVIVTTIDLILFAAIFWVALRALRAQQISRSALQIANKNLAAENALRNSAVEQLKKQANHLREIVLTQTELVQSQFNVDHFLELVVKSMLNVTPATGAVVEIIDGDTMIYEAASGSIGAFLKLRLPRTGSLSGLCVEQNSVLISDDTSIDTRVDRAACEKVGAASMVVAPLLREGEPIGVLKIVAATPAAFDSGDVQTLQLMSGLLGSALGHQLQFEKNNDLLADRNITLATLERELRRRQDYETTILKQRQRTEAILEASHEAFICIDQHSAVREWNAQAAQTFGWSKEEAFGKSLDELIIPARFHEDHHRGIAHFLQTGNGPILDKRIELPALRRDGSEIPIELTITARRDGDSVEFPCFLRDISERKRAEAVLLQQQATLRSLTDAVPALISFIGPDENYRYCNEQYKTIFDIAPATIVGTSLRAFLGAELYRYSKAHIDSALAGEAAVYERTIQTKIGMRHQECRHIPQTDDVGEPNGFYLVAWDITERKAQELEWQSRASIDQLTGLLNRAAFMQHLELAVPRHRRAGTALAVFYLDVDHFKQINDTYGHAAGDALLKKFAEWLRSAVRTTDYIGRLGGDEFCILLDNIKVPENACVVAEKILELARDSTTFENHVLTISTSIGIVFVPTPELSGEQYLAQADSALYKAKQGGRNRFVLETTVAASQLQN
ncbi:MAG TPA: diguanylate cyclase [Spongiibacteraceae bacterium]|nr:diguanylate cyclase [Spongiibacteraceae bacterium]